ncbi:MAG: adenylate cyclase [Gammaproteobacteria bacterium]|jgi:adenylate cyclase
MNQSSNADTPLQQVVVLFADICGSSRFYRELGDAEASILVADLLNTLTKIVIRAGGEVVDKIGDELMCSFANNSSAILCAVDLHRGTIDFSRPDPRVTDIAIRIGLHAGQGIKNDGKPVGDPVYVAKRLTDQAKAGQILVSADSIAGFPLAGFEFRFVEEMRLKGQSAPTTIFEIIWDNSARTELVQNDVSSATGIAIGLELLTPHNERHTIMVEQSITIGRTPPAVLVVNHTTVSRLHAHIESRKGRFVLTDVSTNGTFVSSSKDVEPTYVRRDEIALTEMGMIGLGRAPNAGAPNTLRYRCVTSQSSG